MQSESTTPSSTTRGPVDRLRHHVSSEWWRDLFDETYLLTDSDVLTEPITRKEVDVFIQKSGLEHDDRILDLCCGQGRHAIELARRGFNHVTGLDQSEYLVDVARKMADENGVDMVFEQGDARDLPYDDDRFDVVLLLGNSFGYFDADREDRRVLHEVRRVLKPGGRVLLDLTDGDYTRKHYQPRSWEWASEEYFVCRERELDEDDNRLIAREIVAHVERGIEEDQFYAERLYGRREVSRLLRTSGFGVPTFHRMRGDSDRGQDLGMMGHRFVVTASVPPTGNGSKTRARTGSDLRYVAVVLGDPRLPDETKLGGAFDDDDYDVVGALREALGQLEEYEFIYFNDHSTLLDDLQTYGDAVDLVFNLCDEGLRNSPRQELHVPALLDTLSIPYTGAGPQCLAHCYDKSIVRGVAAEMGISIAEGYVLRPGASLPETLPVPYPVIVKPNAADNSAGMTVDCIARDREALVRAVDAVRHHVGEGRMLLIERFLTGADLTYGVLGNPTDGYHSLPVSEDDYSRLPKDLPRFCGYEAKWDPTSPYWTDVQAVPATLPDATRDQIRDDSHLLFERLGCRDYARFDWRLDADGRPHLLEANPNPGWSWDSHLVEAASFEGASYADVLARILEAAYRRHGLDVRADAATAKRAK